MFEDNKIEMTKYYWHVIWWHVTWEAEEDGGCHNIGGSDEYMGFAEETGQYCPTLTPRQKTSNSFRTIKNLWFWLLYGDIFLWPYTCFCPLLNLMPRYSYSHMVCPLCIILQIPVLLFLVFPSLYLFFYFFIFSLLTILIISCRLKARNLSFFFPKIKYIFLTFRKRWV